MAANGRRRDGWKTWKVAWDGLRVQVEAELRREKLRGNRGRRRHPRRVARLKACAALLYALRATVRALGRAEAVALSAGKDTSKAATAAGSET